MTNDHKEQLAKSDKVRTDIITTTRILLKPFEERETQNVKIDLRDPCTTYSVLLWYLKY